MPKVRKRITRAMKMERADRAPPVKLEKPPPPPQMPKGAYYHREMRTYDTK